jgi:ATPase family associated with various cellular activities (AAA)
MHAEHQKSLTLIECVELVKNELHTDDFSQKIDPEQYRSALLRVRKFFGCTEESAKILSHIVMEGYENNAVSPESIRSVLGLPLGKLKGIEEFLRNLYRIGLVSTRQRGRNSIARGYDASPNLLDAVFHECKSLLKTRPIEHAGDLVHKMFQIIEQFRNLRWHHSELYTEIKALHRKHRKMPIVKWVEGLNLSDGEVSCFYYVLFKRLEGEVDIDLTDFDKALFPHPKERFGFKRKVIAGALPMISQELIRVERHMGGKLIELNLGQAAEAKMPEFDLNISVEEKENTTLEKVRHQDITRKTLIFDAPLSEQMEAMHRLLSPNRLTLIQEKLKKQGMNPGILAIFHGVPGSGKTESVLQLAAETGRDIYRVNIANVRNKYVGESEKGVKNIFEQYRKLASGNDRMPILLFNEADAVLGKRIAVNSSVDQMNNSMQNILLEEMETFQGIFIATTNLALHLDEAFERRFTYKLKFSKAGEQVRSTLWRTHFPELTESEARTLSDQLDLSPAQIENLRKRWEIHQVLFEEAGLELSFIKTLAEQETLKPDDHKPVIGFRNR